MIQIVRSAPIGGRVLYQTDVQNVAKGSKIISVERDDKFIAHLNERPSRRVYISVTRVAKDQSWADIKCHTWAVMWRKRQPIQDGGFPFAIRQWWDLEDLEVQEKDHMAMLREGHGS